MTYNDPNSLISLYFEADRTSVKKRYESLFSSITGFPDAKKHVKGSRGSADQGQTTQPSDLRDKGAAKDVANTTAKPVKVSSDETFFDDTLEELLSVFKLSGELSERIRNQWQLLDDYAKGITLHFMDRLDNTSTRIEYIVEGLYWQLGPWIATHLAHPFAQYAVFPIDADQRYYRIKEIMRILGLEFDDNESLEPAQVILNISNAVFGDFVDKRKLEPWQAWALIYDLGPRLLPERGPYPVSPPPKIWMFAASPENFAEVDGHKPTDEESWTTNIKAKRGDIALMYCLAPRSSIVAAYRIATDAYRDPLDMNWSGIFAEITDKLDVPPITFREMQKDPVLKDWALVKTHFTGLLKHNVSDVTWKRLKELVASKDAEKGQLLEQYAAAAQGARAIRWSGDAKSEKEFEDDILVPLLRQLGWTFGRDMQRQFEMPIKVGSGRPILVRADFVGFEGVRGATALLVLEGKRRITSETDLSMAVQQGESYAGKLRCTRFAVAAPQGVWVYELQFPGQSRLLTKEPVNLSDLDNAAKQLMPLIGRKLLRTSK